MEQIERLQEFRLCPKASIKEDPVLVCFLVLFIGSFNLERWTTKAIEQLLAHE